MFKNTMSLTSAFEGDLVVLLVLIRVSVITFFFLQLFPC